MNSDAVRVYIVRQTDAALTDAFVRLMPQLSVSLAMPDGERLRCVVESPNTCLFCADVEHKTVGVLSLAWYDVPSGRRAWIEDVVVDASCRRQGVGDALVCAALAEARRIGADTVSLTSHVSREAAHVLYRKAGFEPYETTLFRQKINRKQK